MHAACLKCGEGKDAPHDRCSWCGYQPVGDDDLVKSVYLSLGRYDTQSERSQYAHELERIAQQIRIGHSPIFDAVELVRLQKQRLDVETVDDLGVLRYLIHFLLPGILIVAGLFGVLAVLKKR